MRKKLGHDLPKEQKGRYFKDQVFTLLRKETTVNIMVLTYGKESERN